MVLPSTNLAVCPSSAGPGTSDFESGPRNSGGDLLVCLSLAAVAPWGLEPAVHRRSVPRVSNGCSHEANHALEHATIFFLEESCGRRFAGRSSPTGFRVVGPATVEEIRAAFDRVRHVIHNGQRLSYISPHCGSNVVTALGLGLLAVAADCTCEHPVSTAAVGAHDGAGGCGPSICWAQARDRECHPATILYGG